MTKQKTGINYLNLLRQKERADPRPWYEKGWPYMRHSQKVKIISAHGGLLDGKEHIVWKIAVTWIRRLSSTVEYDLRKKLFVFEEQGKHDIPRGERTIYAKVNGYRDRLGQWIPAESQNEQVRKGDYLLADIELYTGNWPRFSVSLLEDNAVHELLHVVRPEIGMFLKNGVMFEDEEFTKATTRKLIRDFRRLGRSERAALFHYEEGQ